MAQQSFVGRAVLAAIVLVGVAGGLGCDAGSSMVTPSIVAGSADAPREVNLIARDYGFEPTTLDLIPGETVVLHVINGGLLLHEAVIGDAAVQHAWEVAEAATVGAPPGPTPVVSVPPEVAGIRLTVASGERIDFVWTVPPDPPDPGAGRPAWVVGCHIPGHWAKGMQVPVRWVRPPI